MADNNSSNSYGGFAAMGGGERYEIASMGGRRSSSKRVARVNRQESGRRDSESQSRQGKTKNGHRSHSGRN